GNQGEMIISPDGKQVKVVIKSPAGDILAEHQVDFSALGPDLSGLSEELKNAIPDGATVSENDQGQILVNGEAWYEPDGDGGWQETDERLKSQAKYKFWSGHERISQDGTKLEPVCPMVIDKKIVEEDLILQGKNRIVQNITVLLPDRDNPNNDKRFLFPVRILEQNRISIKGAAGLEMPILWDQGDNAIKMEEFLDLIQRGDQIEIELIISTVTSLGETLIGDLLHAQGINSLNGVLPEDTILPFSGATLKIKYCH
ncbi:MAG: hypothetical protein ACOYY3_06950, partial [Chloroflexota bacterium]